jgi:hypothetical protein
MDQTPYDYFWAQVWPDHEGIPAVSVYRLTPGGGLGEFVHGARFRSKEGFKSFIDSKGYEREPGPGAVQVTHTGVWIIYRRELVPVYEPA